MHNVYILEYDSPVSKIALYMLQGNNRISLYIRRILAIPLVKSVVATGEYLRENHEFRVWGSRKLKFPHVQSDWTKWDKYMLNGITRQILRYVPACSVRLNRYIVQCKALPSQQQCWNSTRLIHRLSLGPNKKSSKILVELAKNSPPSLGEEPAPAKVSFVFSD